MKIESVDFYYLSMPEVLDIGDGSQDALLVRIESEGYVGWGECEASPLVSIASWVCPMSHSACKPLQASILGENVNDPQDIKRLGDLVRSQSLDLLQADHTLSGIDIALWDLLGKKLDEPVWKLLGYRSRHSKIPYASVLFGDHAQETYIKGKRIAEQGFRAAKFGWGPFGKEGLESDLEQLRAAREGLGPNGILLIDAGTVWNSDLETARLRMDALLEVHATWLEEPFISGATAEYRALADHSTGIALAGGEGCHNFSMAKQMIDQAGIRYVQIDAGRIGGISVAKQVADLAVARGVTYVNHTFTSNLALSASLQPYAGLKDHEICEFPTELKPLATAITRNKIDRNEMGMIEAPDRPGLGVMIDVDAIAPYLVDVEIKVGQRVLYRTPPLRP